MHDYNIIGCKLDILLRQLHVPRYPDWYMYMHCLVVSFSNASYLPSCTLLHSQKLAHLVYYKDVQMVPSLGYSYLVEHLANLHITSA